MEDESLRFGPNGGLVFCMEYFANNFSWLEESLGHVEDDYVLFDCPGKYMPMFGVFTSIEKFGNWQIWLWVVIVIPILLSC